jgi:acyl-[acyl-carrier-protein]-phospholipid O-acyltransferase/long-chain-fatty-acid--[acyl-carrier-protein] ligase
MNKFFQTVGLINYLFVVFLNAFTDLGHKIIIQNTIFKIYDGDMQIILTAVVNTFILLPFIMIFSPSGFLADRFAKSKIMEYSALFAIVITLLITYSYYHGLFLTAFFLTFMLSFQSAIYAPAKYGYIKELVENRFLSSANGAVQAVTTVAILSGIIFYTVLFENLYNPESINTSQVLYSIKILGWLLVFGSIIEYILASKLPNKQQEEDEKPQFLIKKYLLGEYLKSNLKTLISVKGILHSVLVLSIFWSISQVILAVFGEYAKNKLGVTNTIYVQGVMALAGIGIVVGSIMVAKYSKYYVHLGFVTLGSAGIVVMLFLIPFLSSMWSMAIIFILFGIFSGFILVPLNAHIQDIAPSKDLGKILAGNNFIQNLFMFFFLVVTTLFASRGFDALYLIWSMVVVSILLSFFVFKEYLVVGFWVMLEVIFSFFHRYNYIGEENIPEDKGVLLLGNHVSWIDWMLLQFPIQRRINYLIDKDIYHWKFANYFFKKAQTIPVSSKASKGALMEAHQRLLDGNIVGLFPEGAIATSDKLGTFHKGYEIIPKDYDGIIIAFYIDSGIFGSKFSRYKGERKNRYFFQKRKINIYFSEPLPSDTDALTLKNIVENMKEKYETQ